VTLAWRERSIGLIVSASVAVRRHASVYTCRRPVSDCHALEAPSVVHQKITKRSPIRSAKVRSKNQQKYAAKITKRSRRRTV
jgi:hypothetical protein